MFIVGGTYIDAKTVLVSVKSSTWIFFKFWIEKLTRNMCRLCLDDSKDGKMEKIKNCGGTTNMTIDKPPKSLSQGGKQVSFERGRDQAKQKKQYRSSVCSILMPPTIHIGPH